VSNRKGKELGEKLEALTKTFNLKIEESHGGGRVGKTRTARRGFRKKEMRKTKLKKEFEQTGRGALKRRFWASDLETGKSQR